MPSPARTIPATVASWSTSSNAGSGCGCVALNHAERAGAERLTREVTALYCCGPAGGGGVRTSLRPRLGTVSCLLPRERVPGSFRFVPAEGA